MRHTHTFLAVLATGILSGCALFQPKAPEPVPVVIDDKPQRTHRHLTVAWDNIGQGGAVMLQPGYVHVLGAEDSTPEAFTPAKNTKLAAKPAQPTYAPTPNLDEMRALLGKAKNPVVVTPVKTTSKTSYAVYEISRWERFCDGGKGMTEQDWKFVTKANERVPAGVMPNCTRPSFNFSSYMAAWKDFCQDGSASDQHMDIARNSTRPSSMKSCKGKL